MSQFSLRRADNGVWFGTFGHFNRHGLTHGFSSRLGGTSQAPWTALNLGLKAGDDSEKVRQNRRLFCQAVGVDIGRLVTAQQVHADRIYPVTAQDGGAGALSWETAIAETDALITNVPGQPLMLFFADCVPVFIYDPVAKVVGISHAGWKGTVAKIAQKTVLAMGKAYQSKPEDCLIGIGPSIGPCCYEVDETVISGLRTSFSQWESLVQPHGERWLLDLWRTNRVQLEEIGVPSASIEVAGVCTACTTEMFYSHRAEKGKTGRMGGVIML